VCEAVIRFFIQLCLFSLHLLARKPSL
jgi:hypothetical protein